MLASTLSGLLIAWLETRDLSCSEMVTTVTDFQHGGVSNTRWIIYLITSDPQRQNPKPKYLAVKNSQPTTKLDPQPKRSPEASHSRLKV